MSKKDRRRKPSTPRKPTFSLDAILNNGGAGKFSDSILPISNSLSTQPPSLAITKKPERDFTDDAKLAFPTDEENALSINLYTCMVEDWNTLVRNYTFAKHTNLGMLELPSHLEDMCNGETRSIPDEAIIKAGWKDTEDFLRGISKRIHEVERLEKENDPAAAEKHEKLVQFMANFCLNNYMHDTDSNAQTIINDVRPFVDKYVAVAKAAFPESNGKSAPDFALLRAMRRHALGETPTPEDKEVMLGTPDIVETWEDLLRGAGQGKAAPLNYVSVALSNAREHRIAYMDAVTQAVTAYGKLNFHEGKAKLNEAMRQHAKTLHCYKEAKNAMAPVFKLISEINTAGTVTLTQDTLDTVLSTAKSLPNIVEDAELKSTSEKMAYAGNKIANNHPDWIKRLEPSKKNCANTLLALENSVNEIDLLEKQLPALKAKAGTGMEFQCADQEYRDAYFTVQSLISRLKSVQCEAEAQYANMATITQHADKHTLERTPIKQITHRFRVIPDQYFVDLNDGPNKLTDAQRKALSYPAIHIQNTMARLHELVSDRLDKLESLFNLMGKGTKDGEGFDKFDIALDQCGRVTKLVNSMVEAMEKRQQEWDKLHPSQVPAISH